MLSLEVRIMNSLIRTKNTIGEKVHDFFVDEEGDTNLISVVIILVIVIALAAIFRKNIANIVGAMWESIAGDINDAVGAPVDIQNDFQ